MNTESLLKICAHYNTDHIQDFEKNNVEEEFITPLGISLYHIPKDFVFQSGLLSSPVEKSHFSAFHCAKYLIHKNLQSSLSPPKEWVDIFSALRTKLVSANMGLIYTCMHRVMNAFKDEDRLLSDGSFALLRSVDAFDPWRDAVFSTYAYHSIQRSLYHKQCDFSSLEENKDEAGKLCHISNSDVDDEFRRVMDIIDNKKILNENEKTVLYRRYGLYDFSELTLQEIGDKIGVCAERVRQIQNRALEKLNQEFSDKNDSFLF